MTDSFEGLNGDPAADAKSAELPPEEVIAKLTAERDGYLDQLQRALADMANYRRRVDTERTNAREVATRGILAQLVPVLDDFNRALKAVPESDRETPWVQGVQLIERKFQTLLEKEGVTQFESLGQPFDPAVHEAVATDEGNTDSIVNEVYQEGYRHGRNLLRPAMVKVGNQPA